MSNLFYWSTPIKANAVLAAILGGPTLTTRPSLETEVSLTHTHTHTHNGDNQYKD